MEADQKSNRHKLVQLEDNEPHIGAGADERLRTEAERSASSPMSAPPTTEVASPNSPPRSPFRPSLITSAGFELGTGISINPSLPEDDAAYLNQEIAGPES